MTRIRLILHISSYIYVYTYEKTHIWDRNSYFDEKRKQHPSQEGDASTAEDTPAESGETSKVKDDEQTPHLMVDLISSTSYGVYGSKPGLNLTPRLLSSSLYRIAELLSTSK